VPKGCRTKDGIIPGRYSGYTETNSTGYLPRTEANVVDSDATLVFSRGTPTGGTYRTVELAIKHARPHIVVDLDAPRSETTAAAVSWIRSSCRGRVVLNVAGPRESKCSGIQHAVCARLVDIISAANGTLFYPLPDEAAEIL
jgi:hypothetical protein